VTDLIEQYRALHRQGKFRGLTTLRHADEISALCAKHGAKTLLDYGSGAGEQYYPPHELQKKWGVEVTCYDPAVDGIDVLPPGFFDGVICIDVLEHIPDDELAGVIGAIGDRVNKFAFFSVCCRPSKKTLPDGRNVHLTIKAFAAWERLIREYCGSDMDIVVRENP